MRRTAPILALSLLAASTAAQGPSRRGPSAVPPPPERFAAPPEDPAGHAARRIARLVRRFPNFRAAAPLGAWRVDERARWSIRRSAQCLRELSAQQIDARPFTTDLTPIPTPVHVRSAIGGVRYRKMRHHAPFIVSCELAARLPMLSRVLRHHGVHTVDVLSSWRTTPATSFHTMGLAIDVHALHGDDESWVVERDFDVSPDTPTCPAPPGARPLRRIVCQIAATGRFSTVITPHYSPGHRDHLHLDVRPDDPRVFVR